MIIISLSSPDIRLESFSPTAKQLVAIGLCKFVDVVACIGRRGECHLPMAFNNLSISLLLHPYNGELKPRKIDVPCKPSSKACTRSVRQKKGPIPKRGLQSTAVEVILRELACSHAVDFNENQKSPDLVR